MHGPLAVLRNRPRSWRCNVERVRYKITSPQQPSFVLPPMLSSPDVNHWVPGAGNIVISMRSRHYADRSLTGGVLNSLLEFAYGPWIVLRNDPRCWHS
ncbi:hypothetical protein M422DRAFT_31713 [Sphaerobolus stellatus SS14]|uniref:Uncharacterized protein n=1 Tax=Sphaerobolus stellatus (strain SS14) TaxID=990650 RepID=A0A0C9VTN3_SPHS4|nr:hypothetical protein M422DRAFT_31713 [Sphaerobolus stellatus SS14]